MSSATQLDLITPMLSSLAGKHKMEHLEETTETSYIETIDTCFFLPKGFGFSVTRDTVLPKGHKTDWFVIS